jgi:mono/diheme cytochrome c family protein
MSRHLPAGKESLLGRWRPRAGARISIGLLCAAALLADTPAVAATASAGASELAATPEQGRYLAAAGNCVSCHTRPGGPAFAGGLPFSTPLGVIYSTNITPDVQTGIGSWSAADLRRAMQHGVARNGDHLFPAFPYTAFTKVSDADIQAIYAYLRTVPAVRYRPPDNGWGFAMRWPMRLWNAMFLNSGRFGINLSRSAEWNRGAYLVAGLGHCGSCHTPRNLLLAEKSDQAYQGGVLQAPVAKHQERRWSAVDLTNGPGGLGAWSVAELAQYFQTGVSARAGTFGPMNEVIVNSLRQLAPEDTHAMAVYLKSLPASVPNDEPVSAQLAGEGAPIYKARCEKCHGRSGRGGMFSGPPLQGSAVVQAADPASLINIVLYGPQLPKEISYGEWDTMPSYAGILNDSQIAAVCNYVRGSWGNRGPAVISKMAAGQR